MGVIEAMKGNRSGAAMAGVAMIVISAVMIFVQSGSGGAQKPPEWDYFTTDDGATFFRAARSNLAPFEHEGKQAVKASVWRCGNREFVGYMERYTPEMHKKLSAAAASGGPPDTGLQIEASMSGREVKRPGEAKWVRVSDRAAAAAVTKIKCEDGSMATPVFP